MQHKIVDVPATVETPTGLKIHIDAFNNVTIVGQNQMKFQCEGIMEFEADHIRMKSRDQTIIESDRHLVHLAKRIDLNPSQKVIDGNWTDAKGT
jgi:hypothetical protein